MKKIPGPDFPTAGFIYGTDGIRKPMRQGAGCSPCEPRSAIETDERTDRERIIVTEIPYQVNKARLIEKIADLVQDERIEGISDIRDESDRDGVRVVIELKRNEIPLVILNNLYKHTQLPDDLRRHHAGAGQQSAGSAEPQADFAWHFVEHRREVVVRRTAFELRKAEERAHILEGLKIALDNLDAVIALIRRSQSPDEARAGLMRQFQLDGNSGERHSGDAAPAAHAAGAQ